MAEPDPKTQGLRRAAEERSEDARARIEKAVRELRRKNQPVNVNAVHRHSGVSRKTIYSHKDLLGRIQALSAVRIAPTAPEPGEPARETSIVAALRRQIADQRVRHKAQTNELRTKLADREKALAAAHGELERLRRTAPG